MAAIDGSNWKPRYVKIRTGSVTVLALIRKIDRLKLPNETMNANNAATTMPGRNMGSRTLWNVRQRSAPITRDASSYDGSSPYSVAEMLRMVYGTVRMRCA